MESYAGVFDEEWMNLGSMFFCDQDPNDFTGHGLFSTEHDHGLNLETPISSSSRVSNDKNNLAYASDHDIKSDFYNHFSQESSNIMDHVFHQSEDVCVMEGDSSNFLFLAQVFSVDAMEEIHCLKQDEVVEKGKMENSVGDQHLKRKYEVLEVLPTVTSKINKKSRGSTDNKNKKNLAPKKMQKIISVDGSYDDSEEILQNKVKCTIKNNGIGNVQSSSSCSSEDDSNASQDSYGRETVTVKTRACRGAATDPQSIYARKRRERINERLRILQTLVPNGTKVDISTMLEEAVHYVKFLQLKINLLSSDDKWMYAPIAYNGVDMGLYNNISPTL